MATTKPGKKKPQEIHRTPLKVLPMSASDWEEFQRGVDLFNAGDFWHAHEAWENVWKEHAEDERLFFQGLIQLAAAYHHLVTRSSYRGLLNNFDKAAEKLHVFEPQYLGVYVKPLLKFIELGKAEAQRLGNGNLKEFNTNLLPRLQFHLPDNPDLATEVRSAISSPGFLEGIELFNTGFFWEAHEAWEDVWRDEEGDAKTIVQAFVQMAAGYSFIKLSRPSAAVYVFEKSIEKFEEFSGNLHLLAMDDLLEHMRRIHLSLQTRPGAPIQIAITSPVPPVRFVK